MFEVRSGSLTITAKSMPKRGECLVAAAPGAGEICMDYCGMNPMLVPDGTNAYMFANRLIVVTRWSDMSDEEKKRCASGSIDLGLYPFKCMQLAIQVGGQGWGDVFFTLHHCYEGQNDEEAPVEEIIFIFADTHDSDYLLARRVKLPDAMANILRDLNQVSRKQLAGVERSIPTMRRNASVSQDKDFCDLLYDALYEATSGAMRAVLGQNPTDFSGCIMMRVNSQNTVTELYQTR